MIELVIECENNKVFKQKLKRELAGVFFQTMLDKPKAVMVDQEDGERKEYEVKRIIVELQSS